MGYDTVSIVSMNSARQQINGFSPQKRGSYLNGLLNDIRPDIGVLPFDPELKNNAIVDYDQYMSQDRRTLLLYDASKVSMHKQDDCRNIVNGLESVVNMEQIAWPEVQIMAPKPCSDTVIKKFSLVGISDTMFDVDNVTERERRLNLLIVMCQRLAMTNGLPVLVAGEIRLPMAAVQRHLSSQNETIQSQFYGDAYEHLKQQYGFLRSMTQGSTREQRDMFKFSAVQCKRRESVVKQWEPEHTDCFLASKALQMSEAKSIKVDEALGRQVNVAPAPPPEKESAPTSRPATCQTSRPRHYEPCHTVTRTEMQIPSRPARHHGG